MSEDFDRQTKDDALNMLILGGYTFEEVATAFETSPAFIKELYEESEADQ